MPLTEYDAGSGDPIAESSAGPTVTADTAGRFGLTPLALIAPSLTNPRKTFDAIKLEELATSIRISGVHQPVLLRPLPGNRLQDTFSDRQPGEPLPEFELVCGERRLRASKLAGLAEIPAVVRDLTDDQVLEIQIVENLQRDDLSELEEAEGYAHLCAATGIDKSAIGDRIGRSRSYVYSRIKLLDLCQKVRESLRAGAIDASKALLIARIPDERLQLKALAEFEAVAYNGNHRLSYQDAQLWIRNNVMLKLAEAKFNTADPFVLISAGACQDCHKRTGADPDLFADIESPDICTDPKCFRDKTDNHIQLITQRARESGQQVIEGKEAQAAKPSRYAPIKGFTSLSTELIDPASGDETPLSELLTKDERRTQVMLFVDPHTNETTEVVSDSLAHQVHRRAFGEAKKEPKGKARTETEDEKKARLVVEYERAWRQGAVMAISPAIASGKVAAFEPVLLREIIARLTSDLDEDVITDVLPGIDDVDTYSHTAVLQFLESVPEHELGARICMLLLLNAAREVVTRDYDSASKSMRTKVTSAAVIESLAASAGVDLDYIKREVQAGIRATQKGPAARAKDEADATAEPEPTLKKKPASRAKSAPDEVQRGIAEAMQNLDEAAAPLNAFVVGQLVRFKSDLKGPGGKVRKCCGKEGVIKARCGDRAWSVSLGPKAHETAIADYTEIEAVEVA